MQPASQPSPLIHPDSLRDLDEHAFSALTEPYRCALQAHCYRLLGCVQEAEELAQETLWRAWRRRETYAGRAPVRAWLYKIATNLCLDALRQRPRRTLPIARQASATPDEPLPPAITEPIWLEPFPDELFAPEEAGPEARYSLRESVTLAFMTALHLLPPRQRAVLILRDVLDWPANEVAELLGQTTPAVKSALHRARTSLAKHYQATPPDDLSLPPLAEPLRQQLDRYVQAWETADVNALLALLKAEATFSMPPTPSWYQGREVIGRLVAATIFSGPAQGRWRLHPTRASGQPGFGLYRLDEANRVYTPYGIQVVTFAGRATYAGINREQHSEQAVSGPQIADLTTFRDPALAAFFKLPAFWPA